MRNLCFSIFLMLVLHCIVVVEGTFGLENVAKDIKWLMRQAPESVLEKKQTKLMYHSLIFLHMMSDMDWNVQCHRLHHRQDQKNDDFEDKILSEMTILARTGWIQFLQYSGQHSPRLWGLTDVAIRFQSLLHRLSVKSNAVLPWSERAHFNALARKLWSRRPPSDEHFLEHYEHEKRAMIINILQLTKDTYAPTKSIVKMISMVDTMVLLSKYRNVGEKGKDVAIFQLLAVHSDAGCDTLFIRPDHVQSDAIRFVRSAFRARNQRFGDKIRTKIVWDSKSIQWLIQPYMKCRFRHENGLDPLFHEVENLYHNLLRRLPLKVQQEVFGVDVKWISSTRKNLSHLENSSMKRDVENQLSDCVHNDGTITRSDHQTIPSAIARNQTSTSKST